MQAFELHYYEDRDGQARVSTSRANGTKTRGVPVQDDVAETLRALRRAVLKENGEPADAEGT